MGRRGFAIIVAVAAATAVLCAGSAAGADGPRFAISRSSASPGARVVLTGHGFPARAPVRVTLARVTVMRGRAGRRGGFRLAFRVPAKAAGLYRLRARVRGKTVASRQFRIRGPATSPAPQPAPLEPNPQPQEPAPEPPPPPPPPPAPPPEPKKLVAAGDIACSPNQQANATANPTLNECHHAATASRVTQLDPDAVAALGDNQYQNGELANYNSMYDPSWGAFKDITKPAVGNHEYEGTDQNLSAPGYFAYFGDVAAGPNGYYRWSLGDWTMFVLNSGAIDYTLPGHDGEAEPDDCWPVSCAADSEQVAWLTEQLDSLPDDACVLAYWHHPTFSSGFGGDNQDYDAETGPMYEALYEHGAELILNGHAHNYERFKPVRLDRTVDPDHGITNFVVGTGGRSLFPRPGPQEDISATLDTTNFGVLELTLGADGWASRFMTETGDTLDEASGTCHGPPEPPAP